MGGVTSNVILYTHRHGVGASGEVGSKAPIPLQYVRYVHLGGSPPQSRFGTDTAVCVSCMASIIIHYRPNLPTQHLPIRKKLPPKLVLIILSICPSDERAIAIFLESCTAVQLYSCSTAVVQLYMYSCTAVLVGKLRR